MRVFLGTSHGRAENALWPLLGKRLAHQLDRLEECDEDYYRRFLEILHAKTYKPAAPRLEEAYFADPNVAATLRTAAAFDKANSLSISSSR